MFERIREMLIKEFILLIRDPKMRFLVFLIPILQTIVFGYAVTTDVKNISTAIFDEDKTPQSRAFIDSFVHSNYFNFDYYITHDQQMKDLMDHGSTSAIIHIPRGFQEDIKTGLPTHVQGIIDGTDSNMANIVQNYMSRIVVQESNALAVNEKNNTDPLHPPVPAVNLVNRSWFNENLESRNYYVPGILATVITLLTLTLTSMAIVREKEIGTMEQVMVTPIQRYEFILGKTIPFILIGFFDVTLIFLLAVFWFDVPMRGQIVVLFTGISFYLLTTLGAGLLISTICQTQQQAMMSAFLFYFPCVLLSGFIFPVSNMPLIIQYFTYLNPLRYFLLVIRGVFLKGVGLEILWPEMLLLALMGVCIITVATRSFKKTI
jgi:ABC-2 type transport system permease protein